MIGSRRTPSRRTAPRRDAMRGPRRAAVAIGIFFAGSLLVVHLTTGLAHPGPAAAETAAIAPRALPRSPAPPPSAAPEEPAAGPAPETGLGVVPLPAPARRPDPHGRDLAACVERRLRAAGTRAVRESAPGRWPAVKRAREQLRQQRLAARADCEGEQAL